MITLDYKDKTPIYEQIVLKIESLIALGVLKEDEKLPSVRQFAITLSTNPNTVQKAYFKLESKGLIYSVAGVGNFIKANNISICNSILLDAENNILNIIKDTKKYGLTREIYDEWAEKFRREIDD